MDWTALALGLVGWVLVGLIVWRLRVNHVPSWVKPAYYLRLLVASEWSLFYTYHALESEGLWTLDTNAQVAWSRLNVASVWMLFSIWVVGLVLTGRPRE